MGSITGIVLDDDARPVEYATVSLFRMRDSTLTNGAITDETGKFKIDTKAGKYFMKIEFIAFTPKILTNVKVHPSNLEVDLKTVSIARRVSELGEVEITAEKSQVEVGLDKKVFNVQKDLSNVGGTASEVLENVPSVIVDVDGNISLRGSENVRILIDGKPSGLMGISPAKALEQIPANTIESIEIVTNPSARYDAEGIAGIINIILKKDRAPGFNGLANLTTGYPHRHNANFSFNHKQDKVNLFGTAGIRYRERPGSVIYHRETTVNDTVTTLDQDGYFTRGGLSYNARLGADFYLNKKNTITISGSFSPSAGSNERNTDYSTSDYASVPKQLSNRTTIDNDVETSLDLNFSYEKKFKKKGRKLTADARYSVGVEDGHMEMMEEYELFDYAADLSNPLEQQTNDTKKQTNAVAQADYIHLIKKDEKLEFGYKSGLQIRDLEYVVEELNDSSDTWFNLSNVSNHFNYDEQVHAGYGIYSNKLKNFSYQLGVRAEQTYVKSTLKETAEIYKKEYLNLFPSIHLSQKLKKDNGLQLSFSRRIRRPRARNLNPFNGYADPLNLWIGNPNLNPELTNSYEFGHMKYWDKSFLGTTLYYRRTDSVISRIRTIDTNGVSTTLPQNLSKRDDFGVEITFAKDITKKWKVNGSFNYFRSILDGGNLDASYASDAFSYTGRLNSTIKFLKGFQFQAMVNYRGPRQTAQGERRAMYFFDIGLKKDILRNRGTLNLKLSDVLNSRQYVMETYGPNFFIETKYRHSSRVFFLNLTYKINHYKAKRQRNGSGYDMEDMGM
jgi:outer membrane receptor protein involved in Fe transport